MRSASSDRSLGFKVPDVFLSYNRLDQAKAKWFADALTAAGFDVWWDTSLRAGEAYDEVTEAALRAAAAVLVLWSPQSVASRWVRAEANLAQRLGTILPVTIEPCERPIMFELIQTCDLSAWTGQPEDPMWQAFVRDIQAHIGRPPAAHAAAPKQRQTALAPPPLSRRSALGLAVGTALAGCAGVVWFGVKRGLSGPPPGNSVGVLPFQTISNVPGQDVFADGLSAELRAELARNAQLQVAAQTSSASVRAAGRPAPEMARQLGVAYLLDGNVRRLDLNARVNAELIDGKSGVILWSQTFDRPLQNIFAVQSEIANEVTNALLTRIAGPDAPDRQDRPGSGHTHDGGTDRITAFDAMLRGRALFESAIDAQSDQAALQHFDAAIAIDPNYAAAHAWRARALSVIYGQAARSEATDRLRQAALAAARRAVDLAPAFADAHSALGFVQFNLGLDARGARAAFDQSLKFGAGDGDVVAGFAMFCARTRRAGEAEINIQRAKALDPLNPTVFRSAGTIALLAQSYSAAVARYQQALTMNPKMSTAHALMGTAQLLLGQREASKDSFLREPNKVFALPGQAILAHLAGNRSEADALLAQLVGEFGDGALVQQAQVLTGWDRPDAALDLLERAFAVHDSGMSTIYTDPLLQRLRDRPRFSQLLLQMGFV